MHQNEFCKNFNLLSYVERNPTAINCFSVDLAYSSFIFRDAGIIEFKPKKTSNTYLILSAGIHGNETAPMEILSAMVSKLANAQLALQVNLLIIIGNPLAMVKQTRFLEFNLNRLFNGEWKNYLAEHPESYEVQRAERIEKAVDAFFSQGSPGSKKIHYDLHTAIRPSKYKRFAIYPYLHERKHNQEQLNFLAHCGIDTSLLYHKPSSTFSYHTSYNYKADAFTLELGKVERFGENNMQDFELAIKGLNELVSGNYQFSAQPRGNTKLNLYTVKDEIVRHSEHSKLNIADDVENFTPLKAGDELLYDPQKPYIISSSEHRIVFPNNKVPVGQRMALIIEPL